MEPVFEVTLPKQKYFMPLAKVMPPTISTITETILKRIFVTGYAIPQLYIII